MIDLITGHQGLPHITAEQVSTINDIFMYGYGEDTIVRLLDGTISQDGRAIVISEGYWRANGYDMQITEDETIAFDPTEAGVSRIDVVYAEILQDIPTGNQRTEFVVIQGTPDVSPSEPPVPSAAPLTTDDLILAIPVAKCTISENVMTFVDQTIPLSDGNVEDINEQLEAIRNVYGSKNLLKNNVNSFAGSGLIVATSTDGTFLVTGTSTASVYINIQNWTDAVSIKAGTKLFCSFSDDNSVTYTPVFEVQHSDYTTKSYTIPPGGLEFTAEKDIIKINAGIDIASGTYMGPNGFIFKPMLCLACMNDGVYAPYAETNRQLTTDLGSKNDAADSSGSAFARIANQASLSTSLRNDLGNKTDAADASGSAFARIAALNSALSYNSSSEEIIGHWYNGKPIYRRVLRPIQPGERGFQPGQINILSDITIPNIEWVVNLYGMLRNGNDYITLPYSNVSNSGRWCIAIYINGNGHPAMVYSDSWTSSNISNQTDGAIIVEYTKRS